MSLLPRTAEEFSSAEYWEKFFKKRGEKAFEWYGDYNKLCGVLHKYIKLQDKVCYSSIDVSRGVGWEGVPLNTVLLFLYSVLQILTTDTHVLNLFLSAFLFRSRHSESSASI